MAFTRVWNAAYEALPTDANYGYEIDNYLRQVMVDVRERIAIDHYFVPAGTDADHGQHQKITFHSQVAKPANVANKGFLYIKDVSAKAELHWEDEDGNELALTSAGVFALTSSLVSPPAIGETAPNTMRKKTKEIFKTASADSPLTAAECSGTIVSNYGMTDVDCTIDLPTAAAGLDFILILPAVRAKFFKLHCPTAQADKIYLSGIAGSDDGNVGVASGYLTGVAIHMFTFKASDGGYDWFADPIYGTWVAS